MIDAEHGERSLSRVLAPEDITVGAFVAVLYEVKELFPNLFSENVEPHTKLDRAKVSVLPREEPKPARVVAVSLPFVLVESPRGKTRILDTRAAVLARLDEGFGALAFERLRKKPKEPEAAGEDAKDGEPAKAGEGAEEGGSGEVVAG